MAQEDSLENLRDQWKETFQKTLPKAAVSKSPAQKKWPVQLDHCFARIILDKVIGIDTPWTKKIKSPAYKNMSREQLQASIKLGSEILNGDADLVDLDNQSLLVRGKASKPSSKRKLEKTEHKEEEEEKTRATKKRAATSLSQTKQPEEEPPRGQSPEYSSFLTQISQSSKTQFQKNVLSLLCQIPRGRYTTYAGISKFLASSPRAVGGALKNNTWAPQVPCHRVLAADGSIGGFGGSWGRKGEPGKNDEKKLKLLREEGMKFDGKGRALGTPWYGFTE